MYSTYSIYSIYSLYSLYSIYSTYSMYIYICIYSILFTCYYIYCMWEENDFDVDSKCCPRSFEVRETAWDG